MRFEALGGQCEYSYVGNFVWFNAAYPHDLDMTGSCALVAVSEVNGERLRTGWRLAYVDTGLARTNSVFPMRDEDQAALTYPTGENCDANTGYGCIGRGYGSQNARGLSLGYVAEHDLWRATMGYEVGLFAYYGTWKVHIAPEAPSTQEWALDFDWAGWQLTPFVGVSARYGYAMAMVRFYGRLRAAEHGCGWCSGVANGVGTQALLGLSVPF